MSQNIELWIGATWTINGVANDTDGNPVDLTGGSVEFRIASSQGSVIKLSGADVTLKVGPDGLYIVTLDANDSRQDGLKPGTYSFEAYSTRANGAGTVQNEGRVTLHNSLKKAFP